MNYFQPDAAPATPTPTPAPPAQSNVADLIHKAAFDYLNNSFSKNPAQPLQAPGLNGGRGGSVQDPAKPQSGLGNATSAASGIGAIMGGSF